MIICRRETRKRLPARLRAARTAGGNETILPPTRNAPETGADYFQRRGGAQCHGSKQREQRGRFYYRCIMRDEFASLSFLAVTIAGIVLLFSGLLALAFT